MFQQKLASGRRADGKVSVLCQLQITVELFSISLEKKTLEGVINHHLGKVFSEVHLLSFIHPFQFISKH